MLMNKCPICLEEKTIENIVLKCHHTYCMDCWNAWKDTIHWSDLHCPLCRMKQYNVLWRYVYKLYYNVKDFYNDIDDFVQEYYLNLYTD